MRFKSKCIGSNTLWLFFFGILAVYAWFGLFLIVHAMLFLVIGNLLLTVVVIVLVVVAVLFALAIILRGLSRLFRLWRC
ncbi:hypothetical protein SporoP37_12220 [Sporosarcina sp. P37]|nr:hypothetical protein SporoP37_12220 [Sporosarcina sp. P37]PID17142.1 hypothetical protein CSV62_15060 [Sporosarcina sp. P35]